MEYTVYSITDNKGELYLTTKNESKARRILKQLAMRDLTESPTNVGIEINDNFLTVIDCNGMLFSEYYLHVTLIEECEGSDWA